MRILVVLSQLISSAKKIDRLKAAFVCLAIVFIATTGVTTWSVKNSVNPMSSIIPSFLKNVRVLGTQDQSNQDTSMAAKDSTGSLKPKDGEKEVVEKREENFKTFQKGANEFRVAGSVGPIHYKLDPFSTSEEYKDIDLTIKDHPKNGSEDWDYAVEQNGYQVRVWNTRSVGEENIKYVAQFRRADKFLEMAPSELIWENGNGDREIISLPKIAEPPIIDNTNYTVTWKNVFGEGIDFRYNISPDKFFKTVIVNKKENLPEPTIDKNGLKLTVVMGLNWDDTVDPSNNFAKDSNIDEIDATGETQDLQKSQDNPEKVLTKDELNSVSEEIKSSDPFSFKDDQGREVWWMGKPKAWDSAEDKHFFDLTQGFRRIDTKVFNDLSLRGDQVFAEDTQYPLYIDTNVPQEQVGAALDDVRRCYSNDLFQTNDWLVMGDSGAGYDKENSGMRFQTVPIAQNANIYNATLSLYGYPNAQGADANVKVKIRAQAADNPGAFSTQADWDTRFPGALTTAAVAWDGFPAWSASVAYPSPNISSVIQELVNRAGWASNNSMVLFVDDYDNRSSVGSRRVAYSYDNSASYGALLNISYYTPGTLNLSGTCKQLNRSTNCADSVVVKVAVNGTLQAQTGSTLTGAWSITGVSANSGDVITVFKDNVADANEAVSVIKLGTGDLTGVALYERHLTIGATLGNTVTNANIGSYDNSVSADEDIFIEVDASGNLTIPQTGTSDSTVNQLLYVMAGNTYQPASAGGKTITTPNLFIESGATVTADSNTFNITGVTTPVTFTGTFSAGTSTFNYVCTTGNVNVTIGTYYNLGVGTITDSTTARTYTLAAGTTTVGNQITVGNGTSTNSDVFAISSRTLELTGSGANIWNVTAKGTVTNGNSTINYNGSSATTIRAMTYYNLGVGTTVDTSAGVTYTLGGDTTVSVLITVGNASSTNSDIFALSNKILTVTRATTAPFTITAKGTFQADTSTVKYQGDAAMAVSNLAYYNLNLDPPSITAARAYTIAANALAISNNLTINATASTAYALTITFGGAVTVIGTTSIAGTTLGTTILDTKAANNYAFTTGALTTAAGGTFKGNNSTVTINGNLTNAGTFGVLNATTTIAGNFTNSGAYSQAATTSLTKTSDAAATITSGTAKFKNLTINGSGSTYTLQDDLSVYGDLTLTAGALDVGSSNKALNIAGSWLNNGGTFNARAGTVSYVDFQSGKTITSNGQSFYNLTINGTNPTFTSSLMHMEGANAGTSFTDENSANTWTAAGTATTSTTQKKFGSTAYSGTGTAGDYITTTNNLSNFQFATAPDFTIDGWFYLNETAGLTTRAIAGEGNGGASWSVSNGHHWTLFTYTDSKLYFQYNQGGGNANLISSTVISATTWTHFAIVKTGGYIKMYIGGVEKASAVAPTYITVPSAGTPTMNIGNEGSRSNPWKGYIDEFRVTKGVGLWNAAFTPPTLTYSSDQTLSGTTTVTNNMTVAKGSLTVGANNLILKNMAQSGGTFVASAANTFSVSGDYTNTGGTFTDSGGTLTLNGSAAQAITAGGTGAGNDFTNLTVTNASASGVTLNDSATILGTFTDITASSKVIFHSGSTYAFNAININGQAVGTRATLTSSSAGVPWNLNITASSPTASNVSVQDSNANKDIDATSGGYDATGNTHWLFPNTGQNINVTGTLYTDLNQNTGAANKPLGISVNGGAVTTGSTDSSGNFSLPVTISDNQMVVVFVKGDSAKGSIVFKAGTISGDITAVTFNIGYVKLSYLTGTEITNGLLAVADNSGDSDMLFSVSGTTATFANGVSLYVKSAQTYLPGGNVIADDVNPRGVLSLENNSMTVHGSWDTTAGSFSGTGSSTVTFDSSSAGETILSNGSSFDNVIFNSATGGWSFSDAAILTGDMTMTAGTLSGSSNITVNGGDVTGNGTIAITAGTFLLDGAGNFGGTTNWSFNNLTFGNGSGATATTKTSTNQITSSGVLTIATAQTLDAGDDTWNLSGAGTTFVPTGTFTQNASTFVYTSASAENVTGSTYYNLQVNHSGTTFTVAGSTTVNNVLTISAGNLDGASQTIILSGSGTPFVNSDTFTASTSTVSYTGSDSTNIAAVTYYNLDANSASTTDSRTKSLLHFDGTNNGTTFTDTIGPTWSPSGNAKTSDTQKKFGTTSGYFDGNGDWITSTTTALQASLASTDFTIDFWTYMTNSNTAEILCGQGGGTGSWADSGGHQWTIYRHTDNRLYFQYHRSGNAFTNVTSTNPVTLTGGWHHVAVVSASSNITMYVDGAAVVSPTSAPSIIGTTGGTQKLVIGNDASVDTPLNGYVDEFRYTIGSAKWTSGFSVPTSAYTIGSYSLSGNTVVSNNLSNTSGSIVSGSNDLLIGGSLTIGSAGTFNAPAAGKAFNLTSNFTNAGTFTHNSGTMTLNGSGLQTITSAGTSFNNLTVTNASSGGVSFADNATVAGTFTDVTPSSKVIFHSASTYAFNAININGQATGTKITLTSSTGGSAWNLNITASSPSASYVSVKDSNANKDIDAMTGGFDATGNTHWLFPVFVTISGTVYTAENKSTNIGANKTINLSIAGGAAATVETGTGGTFSFTNQLYSTNDMVSVYISGETEKGSLVTQTSNGTANMTGLELYSGHVVLTYATSGPMTNTLLAIADNVSDSDSLIAVDGSSVATFTAGNQLWIPTGKTYTPGGAIIADDVHDDGTLTLAANAATIHGSWDSSAGNFSTSGTVTFDASSGTETLNTGGIGVSEGWTVASAGDSAYDGTYSQSGTYGGQPAYTNGSKWLFYDYAEMPATNYWFMGPAKADMYDPYNSSYYYSSTSTLPSTWYVGMNGTPGAPTVSALPSYGGTFTNLTKSGGGSLQLTGSKISITGTLTTATSNTFDLNDQNLTLVTLANNGTLKAQGGETVAITNMDTDSGVVEYTGSSSYSSLNAGTTYYGLKFNGSGTWTLGADTLVNEVLNIAAGTFNAGSKTMTLAGSGTPLVVAGTLSPNGTITYTGSSATNVAGTTYENLKINYTGTTFTAAGNMSISGVLTIQAGTFDGSDKTITLSGTGTPLVNSDTFTASNSTVKFTGPGSVTVPTVTYYNLEINNDDTLVGQPYPLTNGLIGHWKFDEANGTSAADSSSSGNTGTVAGTPAVITGKYSNARNFSGESDVTTITSIPISSTDYSIATWFKYPLPSPSGSWRTLTRGSGGDHQVIVSAANKLGMYANSGGGFMDSNYDMSSLSTGWHHLVAVGSGTTTEFYIDGSDVGTSNYKSITDIYAIGNYQGGTQQFGSIDDFRIYNRALSQSDITNLSTGVVAGTYTPAGNLTVANNLTMAKGTFNSGTNDLNIGNFIESNGVFTAPPSSKSFNVSAGWNKSGGTFTHNSATVTFTGDALIQGATTFNNFNAETAGKTLSFESGATQTVSGTWTVNGSPSNHIILQRYGGSGQWNINPTSVSINGVTVSNSNNLATDAIAPTNSTNGGGNTNWDFGGGSASVSGTVFTAENGSTNIGANKTVALSINGATVTTVKTASDGTFNFPNLSIGSNNTIAVYISGETEKGSTVTQASNGSSISGVDIYTGHVVLSHQTAGPITNTILATVDNVADSDLLVAVSGSSATFTSGNKIWIKAGKTYTPGGTVSAGSLEILSTANFTPEANTVMLSDSGTPFIVTGTFNQGTSTIIYTGSSATNVAGTTYNNLTVNQAGTTFTSIGSTTVGAVFTIQAGTFDASSQTIILSGSGTPFVKTGTFTASTSTIRYTGAGDTTVVSTTYNNLETKASATAGGGGWTLTSAGDANYNGDYAQSGTYGSSSKPAYTNGSRWLFSDFADMPMADYLVPIV